MYLLGLRPERYRTDATVSTAAAAGLATIVATGSTVDATQHADDSMIVGVEHAQRCTETVRWRQVPHASR
jgi:hypothetical protein